MSAFVVALLTRAGITCLIYMYTFNFLSLPSKLGHLITASEYRIIISYDFGQWIVGVTIMTVPRDTYTGTEALRSI